MVRDPRAKLLVSEKQMLRAVNDWVLYLGRHSRWVILVCGFLVISILGLVVHQRFPQQPEEKETVLTSTRNGMRLVCISDTHDAHEQIEIPDGDVLIHAGDFSNGAVAKDVERFNAWLGTLPHRRKIVISGNMDFAAEKLGKDEMMKLFTNADYLCDSTVTIDGVVFYGSPHTPEFVGVYQLYTKQDRDEVAKRIPDNVDVLITHGPPYGTLDSPSRGGHVGCTSLARRVAEVQPKVHLFGHIHASYGMKKNKDSETTFANCAQYPKFEGAEDCHPIVIDI